MVIGLKALFSEHEVMSQLAFVAGVGFGLSAVFVAVLFILRKFRKRKLNWGPCADLRVFPIRAAALGRVLLVCVAALLKIRHELTATVRECFTIDLCIAVVRSILCSGPQKCLMLWRVKTYWKTANVALFYFLLVATQQVLSRAMNIEMYFRALVLLSKNVCWFLFRNAVAIAY